MLDIFPDFTQPISAPILYAGSFVVCGIVTFNSEFIKLTLLIIPPSHSRANIPHSVLIPLSLLSIFAFSISSSFTVPYRVLNNGCATPKMLLPPPSKVTVLGNSTDWKVPYSKSTSVMRCISFRYSSFFKTVIGSPFFVLQI